MSHDRVVYWSDEDNCYIGLCPSLFYGGTHGMNEKRVRADLDKIIREWEAYEQRKASGRKRTKPASRSRTATRTRSQVRTAALMRRHRRARSR
jgi:hypothetical protein